MRCTAFPLVLSLLVSVSACRRMPQREGAQASRQNGAIAHRVFEEVSRGNLAVMDEMLAADYIFHGPTGDVRGRDTFKQGIAVLLKTFPDWRLHVEDQITEGDKVATRFTVHATQRGEFQGIPPTGKEVTYGGIIISRIASNKVAEEWEFADSLGMMQQLGVLPPLGQAAGTNRK